VPVATIVIYLVLQSTPPYVNEVDEYSKVSIPVEFEEKNAKLSTVIISTQQIIHVHHVYQQYPFTPKGSPFDK